MGSIATSKALDRVLARHQAELVDEILDELPPALRVLNPTPWVSNEGFYLRRVVVFQNGDGTTDDLELRQLTLSELSYRYPNEPIPF